MAIRNSGISYNTTAEITGYISGLNAGLETGRVANEGTDLRIFVEVLEDGEILRAEMLTQEIEVSGDVDW